MPRPKKESPNHGEYYEVKITIGKLSSGKLERKSFYSKISKADAKTQAEQYKIDKAASEKAQVPFINKEVTFKEWAEEWLKTYKQGKVKDNTYRGTYENPVKRHLIPSFGNRLLKDIKPIEVQQFFDKKSKTNAHDTIKKMRMCLKAIFDTAIENDLCYKNPVTKSCKITSIKAAPEKAVYSQEEYDTVYDFAKKHVNGLDIMLMLATGITRSELLGLKWEDIDFKKKHIVIKQGVVDLKAVDTGKWTTVSDGLKNEYRQRKIPIDDDLIARLMEKPRTIYIGGNKKKKVLPKEIKPEFVFYSPNGKMFSPKNWSARVYDTFMEGMHAAHSEVPILTPHELRHTRATLWVNDKVDLFTVARLLGHSDLDMLAKRYAHSDLEVMRKAIGI